MDPVTKVERLTLFPAGAGMKRWGPLTQTRPAPVPRRRGDEPTCSPGREPIWLCSPQARG